MSAINCQNVLGKVVAPYGKEIRNRPKPIRQHGCSRGLDHDPEFWHSGNAEFLAQRSQSGTQLTHFVHIAHQRQHNAQTATMIKPQNRPKLVAIEIWPLKSKPDTANPETWIVFGDLGKIGW